jgi:two-component system, LytTR family, sensor kinase
MAYAPSAFIARVAAAMDRPAPLAAASPPTPPDDRDSRRRRHGLWTLVAAAAWLLHALVAALQQRELNLHGESTVAWQHVLATHLASAALWIPITALVLWLADRFPLGRGLRPVLVHLAGMAAALGGRVVAVVLLNPYVLWYPTAPSLSDLLLFSMLGNVLLYGLLTGVAHAIHFARQSRIHEAQLAAAQLHALRSQMQPHFLFNALNTIASLLHDQPDKAERMVAQLGALLRQGLGAPASEVPLEAELALLRSYLAIEEARFEDRLVIDWSVDPAALDSLVPPLLLQPLAENAIRHGLAPRAARGSLQVATRRENGRVRLEVRDDGVGLPGGRLPREGVGLANIRARLEALYGSRHTFDLASRPEGGVEVVVTIPYRAAGRDR